jgi:hypothetical protein
MPINYDKKYDFKLFLASCEINYRCCKDTPTRNWLVSFYYLRRMPKQRLLEFLEDAKYGLKRLGINEERTLFLDSGAFSFQNAAGCIAGRNNNDKSELGSYELLNYALDYLEFIKAYGHYFDIIVEVDVDYILGVKKTRYLFERMRSEVPQLRPVWHIPRGDARWEEECKEFKYHGIEGQTRHRDDPISFYNQYMKVAHENNSRVHGFAMTALDVLYRVPFDSVDSASWMLQAAMGTVKTPFGTIAISDRSLMTAETGDILNYGSLNTLQRKEFEAYAKKHGFEIEDLKKEWKARAALNTYYYTWMQDTINKTWSHLNAKKVYQRPLFKV